MSNLSKFFTASLVFVLAGSMVPASAYAEEGSGCGGPPPFATFDMDGNGFISEAEFYSVREQRMAAKAAEGKKMRGAANAPTFADIDTDGDGQLNPEELAAAQKIHMEKNHAMHKGHDKGQGAGGGKGKCSGDKMKMKGNMPTFSDFDLNGDGEIVEAEFNEAHAKRMSEMAAEGRQMKHVGDAPGFSGIDTNGDGEISEEEFAAHQAEHHHQMQHGKHQQD